MSGYGGYGTDLGNAMCQEAKECFRNMIDIVKKYKTRNGRKALVITTIGPDQRYPVVVAYQNTYSGWEYDSVTSEGRSIIGQDTNDDLIEVKPPKPFTMRRVIEYTGTKAAVESVIGGYAPSHLGGVKVTETREEVK